MAQRILGRIKGAPQNIYQIRRVPKIGDMVMVHHDHKKRQLWGMVRIEDLIMGESEIVRGAKVKICRAGKDPSIIERPIEKLFPLEMGSMKGDDGQDPRPKRGAARVAEEKRVD